MNETWVDIPETGGVYKANRLGQILSTERIVDRGKKGKRLMKAKVLRQGDRGTGYMCVQLFGKTRFVARIIAELFIPNPENKSQVNHINGIKSDNRVENLEWVTPSENIIHSFRVLKRKTGKGIPTGRGINSNRSIQIKVTNLKSGETFVEESFRAAEKRIGAKKAAIAVCFSRKRSKYKGYSLEIITKEEYLKYKNDDGK